MAIEEILTMVSNVGFPIACCIVMFLQNGKLQNTLAEISTTMQVMSDRINNLENKQ